MKNQNQNESKNMKQNNLVLVGVSRKTAEWLGMAPAVAGGCIATSEAAGDAAQRIGYDCIGLVPRSWSGDYTPLTAEQISVVAEYLSRRCSGWRGAELVNIDRKQTAELLGVAMVKL